MWKGVRKHSNNDGNRQIKNGKTHKFAKELEKKYVQAHKNGRERNMDEERNDSK